MRKKANLNSKEIKDLLGYVKDYKKSLQQKNITFSDKIMDVGIQTAQHHLGSLHDVGNVGTLVGFKKDFSSSGYNTISKMIAYDTAPILTRWIGENGEKKSAQLSAIDMYEFGSGAKASASQEHTAMTHPQHPVGRGTFPSQDNLPNGNENHANQSSWSWFGLDKQWHSSTGITPTMPLYNAMLEMNRQGKQIAKEVYKFE